MNRKTKLLLNTGSAVVNQLITLVCGLILPRLIISYYGSEVNGLVSSITQFLAFFSLMEMGVGGVVRAALYKPLAEKNTDRINQVLTASKNFFSKIGGILLLYSAGLMVYFPIAVNHSLGYLPTALLVLSIAFSSVVNYMFGIVYQQLLSADQKSYIFLTLSSISTILNTVFGVILIKLDASIVTVKMVSALVLLIRPICQKIYVDRHYAINTNVPITEEPLKQKWNALAQHIASYILKHADTVILTMFSTLENVSIYFVYHLVTNGLYQLVEIITIGFKALLGDMYARNQQEILQRTFSAYEWLIHTFVTLIFSIASVMILPFVSLYTKGVNDADYIVPLFSAIIILANAAFCIRIPYNHMIVGVGHFKQTQNSAIIEAAMNVVVSVILVAKFGLVGVAVGTLAAMVYRTCYFAWYLKDHVLFRPINIFVFHVIVDIVVFSLIVFCTRWVDEMLPDWKAWIITLIKVTGISVVISGIVNTLVYRKLMRDCVDLLLSRQKRGT